MKRFLLLGLVFCLAASAAGCGKDASTEETEAEEDSKAFEHITGIDGVWLEEVVGESGSVLDTECISDVKTENTPWTTTITIPARLAEGLNTTQEALDANAGTDYTSATLNEDGTITYTMTGKQHKKLLESMEKLIDLDLQDMIDDGDVAITAIEHNDDFTRYDLTLNSNSVSLRIVFMANSFPFYSGLYEAFSGHKIGNIVVNYRDPAGKLIESDDFEGPAFDVPFPWRTYQ